jgi:hypothetical protein
MEIICSIKIFLINGLNLIFGPLMKKETIA